MSTTFKQKFAKSLALILPGIFLLGFNIGTGSVTAMAKAGATYGMSMLWTIIESCFTTYFLINLYGKYTLVTEETALHRKIKNSQFSTFYPFPLSGISMKIYEF